MSRAFRVLSFSSLILIPALLLFAAPTRSTLAEATEEPTAVATESVESGDLSDLKLEIVDTQVVDKITEKSPLGGTTTLQAKTGFQLIVVTLEGIAPCTCVFRVRASEFAAVWEMKKEGKSDPDYGIELASAYQDTNGWSIVKDGSITVKFTYFTKTEPVSLKVAFTLDKKITNFRVRFPVVTKGEAIIK